MARLLRRRLMTDPAPRRWPTKEKLLGEFLRRGLPGHTATPLAKNLRVGFLTLDLLALTRTRAGLEWLIVVVDTGPGTPPLARRCSEQLRSFRGMDEDAVRSALPRLGLIKGSLVEEAFRQERRARKRTPTADLRRPVAGLVITGRANPGVRKTVDEEVRDGTPLRLLVLHDDAAGTGVGTLDPAPVPPALPGNLIPESRADRRRSRTAQAAETAEQRARRKANKAFLTEHRIIHWLPTVAALSRRHRRLDIHQHRGVFHLSLPGVTSGKDPLVALDLTDGRTARVTIDIAALHSAAVARRVKKAAKKLRSVDPNPVYPTTIRGARRFERDMRDLMTLAEKVAPPRGAAPPPIPAPKNGPPPPPGGWPNSDRAWKRSARRRSTKPPMRR